MAVRYQAQIKTGTAAMAPGAAIRLFIYDTEYTGSVGTVVLAGNGVVLDYTGTGNADVNDVVKSSTARITLLVNSSEINDFIISVGTSDPFRFGVKILYEGADFWVGYIDPQQISIPYDCPTNYQCELVATDMIGQTKNIDLPQITSPFDWLQYLATIYAPATQTRDGLALFDLVDTYDYHIAVVGDICEARTSRYYNRIDQTIDWRFSPDDDATLFDFLVESMAQLNMRVFQRNGILWLVDNTNYIGASQLDARLYTYKHATGEIEYYGTDVFDCTHTPINMVDGMLQYLPGINEVVATFKRSAGTDEWNAQNATKQMGVQQLEINRLDYLTANYPTFDGTTHMAFAGFNTMLAGGGAYGYAPIAIPTFTKRSWELRDDLVANGQFLTTSTTGWTANNATITAGSGQGFLTCTTSGADAYASTQIACVVGQQYMVSFELTENTNALDARLGIGTGVTPATWGNISIQNTPTLQMYSAVFTATATTHYINVLIINTVNTQRIKFANVKAFKTSNLLANGELIAQQRAWMQRQPAQLFMGAFHTWFDFLMAIRIDDSFYLPHRMALDAGTHTINGEWFKIWAYKYAGWIDFDAAYISLTNDGAANNTIAKLPFASAAWGDVAIMAGTVDEATTGVQFSWLSTSPTPCSAALGLDSNAGTVSSYSTIDHCIYITTVAPGLRVYENGVSKYTETYTPSASDVFRIQYNGRFIEYIKNGVVFYRSMAATTLPLQVVADMYHIGAGWQNVALYGNNIG